MLSNILMKISSSKFHLLCSKNLLGLCLGHSVFQDKLKAWRQWRLFYPGSKRSFKICKWYKSDTWANSIDIYKTRFEVSWRWKRGMWSSGLWRCVVPWLLDDAFYRTVTCRATRRHNPKNVTQHFSVQERTLRCVADLNVAETTDTLKKDRKELFSLQLFSKLHFRLYTFFPEFWSESSNWQPLATSGHKIIC